VTAAGRARRLVWLRRAVQTAGLLLFLGLLVATRQRDGAEASPWLQLWFDLDPLVLLGTWLSAHSVAGLSLLALITVAVTLVLGRVFCGWLCPLGTLHNAVSALRRRGAARRAMGRFSPWQRLKLGLLAALLVMALFGVHWLGVLDPFGLFTRSMTTAVLPALDVIVGDGATAIYAADPRLGPFPLTRISEPVYRFFRDHVFHGPGPAFDGAVLVALIFTAALVVNLVRPRFWCRYVCPLGALLGLLSRRAPLRLVQTDACTHCGKCAASCPAAAQPEKPGEWLPGECFGCWNCVAACPVDAVDFAWEPFWRRPRAGSDGVTRRGAIKALAAGLGGLLVLRLPPQARARAYNPALVRPPGARSEREFLQRCVQCGLCMKACPTNALQPTLLEAGLEGLWTPVLVPRLGYCEYECKLCGEVCPTEAIQRLTLAEKKETRIGLAVIDTTRCLPYAYGRSCIVCEEHCPVPEKAIYFVETEVPLRGGGTRVLKQPKVDADRCIGCGICEAKCPFQDRAAIRVTSAGESRHPDNQPILPGAEPLDADPYADPYGG